MSTRSATLLTRLDGSGSRAERKAVAELAKSREGLAHWLLKRYRAGRGWKARRACVYYAVGADPSGDDVKSLALAALNDPSRYVRYRACELLAFMQREDALPEMRAALKRMRGGPGSDDVRAAMDAIERKNRHYFLDREHSGMMKVYTAKEFLDLLDRSIADGLNQED